MKGLRRTGHQMAGLCYSDQTKTLSAFNRVPTDFVCLIPRSINSSPPSNKLFLPTRNGYVQKAVLKLLYHIYNIINLMKMNIFLKYIMTSYNFVYIDSSSGERNIVYQTNLVWQWSYTWLTSCSRVHLHSVCMSRWTLSQGECVLLILNIIFIILNYNVLMILVKFCFLLQDNTGLNLKIEDKFRRAFPSGTGGVKSITNYSPVSLK